MVERVAAIARDRRRPGQRQGDDDRKARFHRPRRRHRRAGGRDGAAAALIGTVGCPSPVHRCAMSTLSRAGGERGSSNRLTPSPRERGEGWGEGQPRAPAFASREPARDRVRHRPLAHDAGHMGVARRPALRLADRSGFGIAGLLIAAAIIFVVGCWAAASVAEASGINDPGAVVIDEIAAQLLVLAAAPLDWRVLCRRLPAVPPLRHLEAVSGQLVRPHRQRRASASCSTMSAAAIYALILLAIGRGAHRCLTLRSSSWRQRCWRPAGPGAGVSRPRKAAPAGSSPRR